MENVESQDPYLCEEEFSITFDGPALDTYDIDAKVLANSLLGISSVIEEANAIINGKSSKIFIKVRANPQPGSFTESLLSICTSDGTTAVCNIITLLGFSKEAVIGAGIASTAIGSLIGIYRAIQNQKIISQEPNGDGCTKIVYGNEVNLIVGGIGNSIIVKDEALKLYSSTIIQREIAQVMSPLDQEGIDEIRFSKDEEVVETIVKSERQLFKAPEKEQIIDNISELFLKVVTIQISGHKKGWRFIIEEGNAPITADVEDEEFLEDVVSSRVLFQNGTILRAKTRITQTRTINMRMSYTILKVYEVINPELEETE